MICILIVQSPVMFTVNCPDAILSFHVVVYMLCPDSCPVESSGISIAGFPETTKMLTSLTKIEELTKMLPVAVNVVTDSVLYAKSDSVTISGSASISFIIQNAET